MLVRSLAIAALVTGISACNAFAAAKPSPAVSRISFSVRGVRSTEVQKALDVAIEAMRSADWLNDPTLTPQAVSDAEEHGTPKTIRFTLQALNRGKVRMLRPTVVGATLTTLELGPPGSSAPLRVVPGANNLPGGFTQQDPTDTPMTAAATTALQLLGDRDWFGRPFKLLRLNAAMTQVVAGVNTYLDMTVATGGQTREASVVMYKDFRGNASLSWARLALPSGS